MLNDDWLTKNNTVPIELYWPGETEGSQGERTPKRATTSGSNDHNRFGYLEELTENDESFGSEDSCSIGSLRSN